MAKKTALPVAEVVKTPKASKFKEITDSVQALYERYLTVSVNLPYVDKTDLEVTAKAILSEKHGDDQTNRLAMLRLWMHARDMVASFERYLSATMNLRKVVWPEAKKAYAQLAYAENVKGHQGQKAADVAFLKGFLALSDRMVNLWPEGRADIGPLTDAILKKTEEVRTFMPNYCKYDGCGEPIVDWIEPVGKNGFKPSFCKSHIPPKKKKVVREEQSLPKAVVTGPSWSVKKTREVDPQGHPKPFKPESAGKRGQGRGPKGRSKAETKDGEKKAAKKAAQAARRGESK